MARTRGNFVAGYCFENTDWWKNCFYREDSGMSYDLFYNRNIGAFTEAEQQKLRAAHIFIAGTGGAGGIQAATLARMGVGKITIMDPGVFDEPDFNRQYAAFSDTLGMNKAEATSHELERLAPYCEVAVHAHKLDNSQLERVVADCSLVIDAIDLQDYDYKVMLARLARKHGKYNMSCPIPDFGAILITFAPTGLTFDEFTADRSFPPMSNALRKRNQPVQYSSETGMAFLSSRASLACSAALSAALLTTEAALYLSGKKPAAELVIAPAVTYIDLFERSFEIFTPEITAKN